MSKNTYANFYAALTDGEEVEISVSYSLGTTHSWWDGKPRPRGLKVSFTPVKRTVNAGWTGMSYMIGDDRGRGFHVVNLARRSDKQGEALAAFVKAHLEELSEAGVRQDWHGVNDILSAYNA
jgi:hypothetical protein